MTWAAAGIALLFSLSIAWSQALPYPNRPIRLIVPYPPGGAIDPLARTYGQRFHEAWGQPVLIDNKPSAGTIVGTEIVAKAAPDGYTVIIGTSAHAVNPSMYSKLPYDPVKDFTPISLLARLPNMLVVNPKLPVKSVRDLIDYLKANRGKVSYSSNGNGSTTHLAGALFNSMAGTDLLHVPYKGSGPSVMSVIAGDNAVTFDSVFLQMPHVKAGKLRALAVTALKRSPLAPDLPTIAESGLSGFEVAAWVGFLAPAGTPREIVQKWHQEITRTLQVPEIRERQVSQGLVPEGSTPELFADFIKADIAKWAKVVKEAGIKLE
ncbi:MAG: tripartite tricarboxylate transporter substrate binding protein [Betaproteobacteria bacterium]|nr:tripartite tricarboxylate transporter substrate binding protein [Betaproteobacteria bacterium]